MAFTFRNNTFGTFQTVELSDDSNQNLIRVAPERGGTIVKLILNGADVLDVYETPDQMATHDWNKNIILFPFPNRLKDGTYDVEGESFQFPLNEPATQTALHGLGMNLPFEVEETPDAHELRLVYESEGGNSAYPFAYRMVLSYFLRPGHFEMKLAVTNLDDRAIPVGLGWHPYFKADPVEEVKLKTPVLKKILVDDRMLPTGEEEEFAAFPQLMRLGDMSFDNAFEAEKDAAPIELKTADYHLAISQQIEKGQRNYFQIFTPPYRTAIAVEPVTCNINAFENGDGLVTLSKGESTVFSCRVQVF